MSRTQFYFIVYIHPICLPYENHLRNRVFDSQKLSIAGFGQTEDKKPSTIKRIATVRGINDNICKRQIGLDDIEDRICAQGDYGVDACRGNALEIRFPFFSHFERDFFGFDFAFI